MAWYQSRWWYVERPFPWLLVVLYAAPVVIVVGSIAAVVFW